jgi:hypothetical protein
LGPLVKVFLDPTQSDLAHFLELWMLDRNYSNVYPMIRNGCLVTP